MFYTKRWSLQSCWYFHASTRPLKCVKHQTIVYEKKLWHVDVMWNDLFNCLSYLLITVEYGFELLFSQFEITISVYLCLKDSIKIMVEILLQNFKLFELTIISHITSVCHDCITLIYSSTYSVDWLFLTTIANIFITMQVTIQVLLHCQR